jgi:hypothetical protein
VSGCQRKTLVEASARRWWKAIVYLLRFELLRAPKPLSRVLVQMTAMISSRWSSASAASSCLRFMSAVEGIAPNVGAHCCETGRRNVR